MKFFFKYRRAFFSFLGQGTLLQGGGGTSASQAEAERRKRPGDHGKEKMAEARGGLKGWGRRARGEAGSVEARKEEGGRLCAVYCAVEPPERPR